MRSAIEISVSVTSGLKRGLTGRSAPKADSRRDLLQCDLQFRNASHTLCNGNLIDPSTAAIDGMTDSDFRDAFST